MKKPYYIYMFLLCFFGWTCLVDNVVVPGPDQLKKDKGSFSHYRVRQWDKGGRFHVLDDEFLIFVRKSNREYIYYLDFLDDFDFKLKIMPEGTPVQLSYVRGFPKIWRRELYEVRIGGVPIISHSQHQLEMKQQEAWKYSGIMAGVFLLLAAIGFVCKPRVNR